MTLKFDPNQIHAITAVAVAGGAVAAVLDRPPIAAGILTGAALLLRQDAKNHCPSVYAHPFLGKIAESLQDFSIPYTYYRITQFLEDKFERFGQITDLDFCWPGTTTAYFVAQKTHEVVEAALAPQAVETDSKPKPFCLSKAVTYVLSLAVCGFLAGRAEKSRGRYALVTALTAFVETLWLKFSHLFTTNARVSNVVQHIIPVIAPVAGMLHSAADKEDSASCHLSSFRCIKAYRNGALLAHIMDKMISYAANPQAKTSS